MSVREINFTLDANGITPEGAQFGGMQFEDNATVVKYTIKGPYKEKIQQTYGEETTLLYRIDFNSMLVGYNPSENLSEENGIVKRTIPLSVTRAGEQFQSVLLITVVDKDGNEIATISSPPSQIYLSAVSRDFAEDIKIGEGVSSLLQKTENFSNAAQKWAKESEESAEIAENNKTEAIKYSADALEYASSSAKSAEEAEEAFRKMLDYAQPKEEGKGLSSNDFTDEYKTMLLDTKTVLKSVDVAKRTTIINSFLQENYSGKAIYKNYSLYTLETNELICDIMAQFPISQNDTFDIVWEYKDEEYTLVSLKKSVCLNINDVVNTVDIFSYNPISSAAVFEYCVDLINRLDEISYDISNKADISYVDNMISNAIGEALEGDY